MTGAPQSAPAKIERLLLPCFPDFAVPPKILFCVFFSGPPLQNRNLIYIKNRYDILTNIQK